MSLNGGKTFPEGYFQTDYGREASRSVCKALISSTKNLSIKELYDSKTILWLHKDTLIEEMIIDFEKAKGKDDLTMEDFYLHFNFDYTNIEKGISNVDLDQWISKERAFDHARLTYELDPERLAWNNVYNSKIILEGYKKSDPVVLKRMIDDFEDAHADRKDLKMKDFYTFYWYTDFQEESLSDTSNLVHNLLSIFKSGGKENICFHLSKDKRFTPETVYKRSSVKGIFIVKEMHSKFHLLNEFEAAYGDKDNLTMQDFYDFNNFEYKDPFLKQLSKIGQNTLSDISSQVKEIQKNSSVVKVSEMNPKYFLPYIFAISIGLYCPFSNKSPDITTPENHQNKLKDYLSFINNIADTWESALDIDFLTSLDTDDLDWFYRNSMRMIDDLQSIDLESQNFVSVWEQANEVLKKYTDISQQDKILWFIEKHGKGNARLQSFREAILNFHRLLIEENVKNPEENRVSREPLVFWREEYLEWPEEEIKAKTFIPYDSYVEPPQVSITINKTD